MKALILNNKVVDLVEKEFPVHSSLTFVDCDNTVQTGDDYDGSSFSRPVVTFDMAISVLRSKRNSLLEDTDWTANSDVTMTNDMKNYRQELRDITNGLTTVAEVEAVTFPTKPE
ncbi:hypothetical protein HTVC115P_gp55 [Pelagibacter phage HTVC115P]|nr:hypothetical protein HTVC115P_gp55 [Pelagibacter phage HTVC115P]|tara:strand:- start:111 stop:452 length:342 start_codon:yes stop_codon:yes gene_type:complete